MRRGETMSAEQKVKIGATIHGRTLSPEWRAKIRATLVGRKMSPECLAKYRASRPRGLAHHGYLPVGSTTTWGRKVMIKVAEDNWRLLSNVLVERRIGRPLTHFHKSGSRYCTGLCEMVHHKNENPLDNRLRNLQLMTNSEHTSHHMQGNKYRKRVA